MPRESIINGWLEDVYHQGIHACDSAAADLERGRKRRAPPEVETHQKKHIQVQTDAMNPIETPTRVLRPRSPTKSSKEQLAYTASITSASASSLVKLTNATILSHSSTWSRSKSPTRARSRSPAKTVYDLENANPPTIYLPMQHPGNDLPTSVRNLNKNVLRTGRRGKGLLPGSIRHLLTPHLEDSDAEDDDLFDDVADDNAEEIFREILRIHIKARKCSVFDKPEASWGEEVVRPLLDLVTSRTNDRVVVENVTSTNIQPTILIPRGSGVEGLQYEGKRVDYGLFIEPTEVEAEQVKERLKRLPDGEVRSINQTEAYYLRKKPFFSSIELKKLRSNHDPQLQLAIWNSALFQRLEGLLDLIGKGDRMMPIPSVTVTEHEWKICYSYIDKDGCTRMLRGMADIGSTADIVGIYRILRSLDAITLYGVKEYWPWLSGCLFS